MEKNEIEKRPEPLRVLMCTPDYFDIIDVKNAHMEGQSGSADLPVAKEQWNAIYDIYKKETEDGNLDEVAIIDGTEGCEDMVFAANQSFPWTDVGGKRLVVMSRMRHESRKKEVPSFEKFYQSREYITLPPPGTGLLEGMGDLIPVPGERVIFGGYGHRTDLSTLEELENLLQTTIVPLQLVSDHFYHLDTCFIPLDEDTALIAPEAFNEEGMESLEAYFTHIIKIPLHESKQGFALNAHIVNGKKSKFAIIQQDNPITEMVLKNNGYRVYTVDTSEYMKSGGSVFCMKMMFY